MSRPIVSGLAEDYLSLLKMRFVIFVPAFVSFCTAGEVIIGRVFFLSFSSVLRPTTAGEACDEKKNTTSTVDRVVVRLYAPISL